MADAYNRASPGSGPRHGRPAELGPVIIEARRSISGQRPPPLVDRTIQALRTASRVELSGRSA